MQCPGLTMRRILWPNLVLVVFAKVSLMADPLEETAARCEAYAKAIAQTRWVYAVEEVSEKQTVLGTDTTTFSFPRLRLVRERYYGPQYGNTTEFTFDGTTMQWLPSQGVLLFGKNLAKFKYRADLVDAPLESVSFVFSHPGSLHLPAELLNPATWEDFRRRSTVEPGADGGPPVIVYGVEVTPEKKIEFRVESSVAGRPPAKWTSHFEDVSGSCEVDRWKVISDQLSVPEELTLKVYLKGRLDRTTKYRLKSFEQLAEPLPAEEFQINSAKAKESLDVDAEEPPK